MLNKTTQGRPTPLSRSLLVICVACSLLLVAAHAQATENACSDTPPDADFTCAEQKKLGKCDRDWMIEGKFCQKTCGRCSSPAATAPAPPRASSRPAPVVSTAAVPTAEAKPPAIENTPTTARLAAVEGPAAELASEPAPQTEPTPAQEQYLAELANEASVLTQEDGTGAEELPPLSLPNGAATTAEDASPTIITTQIAVPPVQEPAMEESQTSPVREVNPGIATVPIVVPSNETQVNAVQVPVQKPECNTTSAWDVLSSDPQLSITRRAAEVMNLKDVLQNPDIKFTLFAPTNEAWNRAAAAEGQPLAQLLASRNVLRDILFSHIIPNRVIDAASLAKMRSITPQTTVPIYVVPPPPGSNGNIGLVSTGSNVRIIQADEAIGCNYALHKINGVLRTSPSDTLGVNPTYTRAVAATAAAAGAGGTGAGP